MTMDPWDQFAEEAQAVFADLEHRFGFHRQTPSKPFIHYDSSILRISLFYDPGHRDGGPDISIRRKSEVGTQKPSFGLSSLLSVQDPVAWERLPQTLGSSASSIKPRLQMLWQMLCNYGTPLLEGDCTLLDKSDVLEAQVAQQLGKPNKLSYTEAVRQAVFRYHGKS